MNTRTVYKGFINFYYFIALNECDAAVHLFISSTQGIEMKSVVKRCELLLVNIQKMSIHFSQVVNSPGALNLSSTTGKCI